MNMTSKHKQKDRLKQNISVIILNINGLNTPTKKVSDYKATSKLTFIIFLHEIQYIYLYILAIQVGAL